MTGSSAAHLAATIPPLRTLLHVGDWLLACVVALCVTSFLLSMRAVETTTDIPSCGLGQGGLLIGITILAAASMIGLLSLRAPSAWALRRSFAWVYVASGFFLAVGLAFFDLLSVMAWFNRPGG